MPTIPRFQFFFLNFFENEIVTMFYILLIYLLQQYKIMGSL